MDEASEMNHDEPRVLVMMATCNGARYLSTG